MDLDTEMSDSDICDCGNIDIDSAIEIARRYAKAKCEEQIKKDANSIQDMNFTLAEVVRVNEVVEV